MKITAVARENFEEMGLVLKNKLNLEISIDAIPDTYCVCIGRMDTKDGSLESYIKKDSENGNTIEFDKIKNAIELLEKEHEIFIFDNGESKKIIDYYVPYDIEESSKNKPTIVDNHVDNEYTYGHYEAEYELLLTCDEATRRIIIKHNSVNIPMVEFLESIEDEVEAVLYNDYDEDNEFAKILDSQDDYYTVAMFDEYGDVHDVVIDYPEEFVSMIVSVRQIKCEFIENDE
nr:MAG TPA: hypothetical protein [Bacteriophage sp.]